MLTRRQFLKASVATAGAFGILTFSACSSGSSSESKGVSSVSSEATATTYKLGDTVSTDIIDFTLKNATFAFYADKHLEFDSKTRVLTAKTAENYALPEEQPNGDMDFTANKGRVLICLEFVIKNNDRAKINIGGSFADWLSDDFNITYDGQDYLVKGYDLNDPDGDTFGFDLAEAITSLSAGEKWVYSGTNNQFLEAGKELTARTVGIASFEPSSLTDAFLFRVDVLNSKKEKEQFVFSIG